MPHYLLGIFVERRAKKNSQQHTYSMKQPYSCDYSERRERKKEDAQRNYIAQKRLIVAPSMRHILACARARAWHHHRHHNNNSHFTVFFVNIKHVLYIYICDTECIYYFSWSIFHWERRSYRLLSASLCMDISLYCFYSVPFYFKRISFP